MAKNRKSYSFSVSDSDSGEKIFSLKGRPAGVIAGLISAVVLIMGLTYLLTAFTPLKKTIPGYPSRESREAALQNRLLADSLQKQISLWAFQVGNIQRVMSGREPIDLDSVASLASQSGTEDMYAVMYAHQDSVLRGMVEREMALDATAGDAHGTLIEGLKFFTPVKGMVTGGFNQAINHSYIEIAADENTTVYSILDGTVVSAGWNDDTGYVMIIQHGHDLLSVYKHNDRLLKRAGDRVKTGTPIAIVGNTGRLSTGVHLHLELWHAGEAIDPAKYISF